MSVEATTLRQVCPMCGSPKATRLHAVESRGERFELARCRRCGLHYTDPRPTEEFLAAYYCGEYHRELQREGGAEYAFGRKYRRYADWIMRHTNGGRFLDIGCATGLLVRMMADRGFQAEGVEINEESAAWGRSHYGVTIHDGPLDRCGLSPESFNVITLTDVLEHTLHPRDFLLRAGMLLKPGGIALISFPDINSIESRYLHLIAKLARRPWLWATCYIPGHIWEFTRATALDCFESAGFELIGFRRSHQEDEGRARALKLLSLPLRTLAWTPLGTRLGSQMEFLIRLKS
ncbi:class I SAM-dependent methyltransferase [Paludisphaera rhizosphaerae]|uniref:class I SAM-dependent methyltransferase n=1 Tax=Paludisphaera rhizosphaerae TaxID=2711216 RepID=UPI0013EC295E|nr:class I SAM-dependent methyltransferase [Paludisphaera rhizosphaerae]